MNAHCGNTRFLVSLPTWSIKVGCVCTAPVVFQAELAAKVAPPSHKVRSEHLKGKGQRE